MRYDALPTVFTADEFIKIMTGDTKDEVVAKYLLNDLNNMSPNLQSQVTYAREIDHEKQARVMRPYFYQTNRPQEGEHPLKLWEYPTYIVKGDVLIDNVNIDWSIGLKRCVFTGQVKISNLKTTQYIQIDSCTFQQGLTLEKVEAGEYIKFGDMMDMSNIQINDCKSVMLEVSGVAVPPTIKSFQGYFHLDPSLKK